VNISRFINWKRCTV